MTFCVTDMPKSEVRSVSSISSSSSSVNSPSNNLPRPAKAPRVFVNPPLSRARQLASSVGSSSTSASGSGATGVWGEVFWGVRLDSALGAFACGGCSALAFRAIHTTKPTPAKIPITYGKNVEYSVHKSKISGPQIHFGDMVPSPDQKARLRCLGF